MLLNSVPFKCFFHLFAFSFLSPMGTPIRNEQIGSKPARRRRKKRRTEDFSDSSSSSSSSDSEDNHEVKQTPVTKTEETPQNINIDDIDIDSDNEDTLKIPAPLTNEQRKQLNLVHFTKTQLSNVTAVGMSATRGVNVAEVTDVLQKDKNQLNSQYLALMASEFGEDLDELRKKPDFNDKSLVILAKTLQSGANMFDPDTLKGLLT